MPGVQAVHMGQDITDATGFQGKALPAQKWIQPNQFSRRQVQALDFGTQKWTPGNPPEK